MSERTEGACTDFTVTFALEAMNGIKIIYGDFMKPENVSLDVHEGAHEIDLQSLLSFFDKYLGSKS